MKDLIQYLRESDFDPLGWVTRNPAILAHNSRYVIGVWYYGLGSDRFKLSTSKEGHLDDPELQEFQKELPQEKLIRGRVMDYEGLIFCIIYLDPREISSLPETILLDIKFRCEQKLKQKIDYVISDSGEILLERSLLEDCEVKLTNNTIESLFIEDFVDSCLEDNKRIILNRCSKVLEGTKVFISEGYLKTLKENAPKTFEYLNKKLGIKYA